MIAERRCLAFAALAPWSLSALDRIVGDGVFVGKIFEQRRERRQAMADRAAFELTTGKVVAPSDNMRPGHNAKFLRPPDAGELHEILDCSLVSPAGAGVGDIGEPLKLRRDVREPLEFRGGQT